MPADGKPATRGDLARAVTGLKNELGGVNKRLGKELVATQAAVASLRGELTATLRLSHSQIMSKLDAFMGQTRTVQTDQTFLIHRVDRLEEKVSALESRGR